MTDDKGLETPQRYWAAIAVWLGTSLTVIDSTVVNIALPIIAEDYQVSASQSILVVNAYQLAVAMFLLPFAGLGDKLGYRKVFLGGFVVFILASIWCANAGSFNSLVIARAVQGAGGAGVMCVGAAMLRLIYPANILGRGIGFNSLVVAGSYALGPSIAALILMVADWPWFFLINIPLGIFAIIVGYKTIPMNPLNDKRFDSRSAVLSALTFGSMLLLVESLGHTQPLPVIAGLVVFLFFVGSIFIRRQLADDLPLFPVDLLAKPLFALSVSTSVFCFAAQLIVLVSLPFFLSSTLGFSAVKIGMLYTAWPAAIMVMALIAGRLADHYHPGLLGGIGLSMTTLGFFMLSQLQVDSTTFDILWRMAICGLGLGLFQSPNTRFIVGSAPRNRVGSVSGLIGTIRLTGQTIGASIAALMLYLYGEESARSSFLFATGLIFIATLLSSARMLPSLQSIKNTPD